MQTKFNIQHYVDVCKQQQLASGNKVLLLIYTLQ